MIQDCKHQLLAFTDRKATCKECGLEWARYSISLSTIISNMLAPEEQSDVRKAGSTW